MEIRKLRKGRGLTQSGLARKTGLSQSYLSQVERGARVPSVRTLRRIAATLGVPVGALLDEGGTGTPKKGRR